MQAVHWRKPLRIFNEATEKWEARGWSDDYTLAHHANGDGQTVCGTMIPEHAEQVEVDEASCHRCQPATTAATKRSERFRPLTRQPTRKPTAVVLEASPGRLTLATEHEELALTGEQEIRQQLTRLKQANAILYAAPSDRRGLRRLGESIRWFETILDKDGEPLSLKDPDLPTVDFLVPFDHVEDRCAELYGFLDFAYAYGVEAGTPHAMARQLWETTLPQAFTPKVWIPESLLREAFKGGREQAPTLGDFKLARYHDLQMAYPTAMASEPFPLELRKASRNSLAAPVGIAQATVRIPSMLWGPLPGEKGTHFPTDTELIGWWSLRELRQCRELGFSIELYETWEGIDYLDLFSAWHALGVHARKLPHGSTIAKYLWNRLWGSWAPSPQNRGVLSKTLDGRREIIPRRTGPNANPLLYFAVEITARVRERVYREALLPEGIGATYVATDGVIGTGPAFPQPYGNRPGAWREDRWPGRTDVVLARDGTYAWKHPPTEKWRISMEAAKSKRVERFERETGRMLDWDMAWFAGEEWQ